MQLDVAENSLALSDISETWVLGRVLGWNGNGGPNGCSTDVGATHTPKATFSVSRISTAKHERMLHSCQSVEELRYPVCCRG